MADTIKVRLVGSVISTKRPVRETVRGLGLHKIGSESVVKRSPQVEGMIRRLKHLVIEVKE
jgi:large subunit ribosomal protein L30